MFQQFYFVLDIKHRLTQVLDALLGLCFVSIHLILAQEVLDSVPCIEAKVSANIQRLNTAQIPSTKRNGMGEILAPSFCLQIHLTAQRYSRILAF